MLENLVAFAAGACIFYRGIVILGAMGPDSNHYYRSCWVLAVGGAIGLIFSPFANYSPNLPAMFVVVSFAGLAVADRRQEMTIRQQQRIHNGGDPHVS